MASVVFERMVLTQPPMTSGLSLLFAPGERPALVTIERAIADPGLTTPAARISHRPPDDEGWAELLVSGLTFEVHGLSPAAGAPTVAAAHRFGFQQVPDPALEAVTLHAGAHIAAGEAMLPVVRAMVGLAANLTLLLPVRAVCWRPAESWMEPRYFARIVIGWLGGGPFPALGLTALTPQPDGEVRSAGLAFFIGQELRVEPRAGEAPADTVKLAMRVIDNLTRSGRVERRTEFDAPSGELVVADPSPDGRRVTIWRTR